MATLALEKPELVNRLERAALDQQTTPAALLDRAVTECLNKIERQVGQNQPRRSAKAAEFLREVAAFEQLKPTLLQQYRGRVVAIYQGRVVAVGDEVLAVHNAVTAEYGPAPSYVAWVDEVTPRRARAVSAWRAE